MYCKHCGVEIPDGMRFCPECGGDLRSAPQQTQYQNAPVTPNYAPYGQQAAPQGVESAAHTIIKKHLGGTLMLVAAILVSASTLLSFLASTEAAFINVGGILMIIAAWLIYATCRKTEPLKTGGFSVLRAYSILQIVAVSIACGAMLLLSVVSFTGGDIFGKVLDEYGYLDGSVTAQLVGVVGGVTFLILAIVFAGVIALCAYEYRFTDSLSKTAKGMLPSPKYGRFFAVMCFITAAGNLISSTANASGISGGADMLAALVGCGFYVLLGIIVLGLDKDFAAAANNNCAAPHYTAPQQPVEGNTDTADSQDGTPKYPSPQ